MKTLIRQMPEVLVRIRPRPKSLYRNDATKAHPLKVYLERTTLTAAEHLQACSGRAVFRLPESVPANSSAGFAPVPDLPLRPAASATDVAGSTTWLRLCR